MGVLGLVWLGCSVQVVGAPCDDDLQCPREQHCGPARTCEEGARTQDMLVESCRAALVELATRADACFGGTAEGYQQVVDPAVVCASVEAGVRAGRLEFVPDQLAACQRRLRELPCGEAARALDGLLLDECAAFVPRVQDGAACGSTAECSGGWCKTANTCPGTCTRFIPVGGACTPESRCQPGSLCASGICRRDAGLGESCAAGVRCDPDSNTYCGPESRCVERRTSGACTRPEECAAGHVCARTQPELRDQSPRECRPVKSQGEECQPGAQECELLHYCDAGTRRCRPWPGAGSACGDVNDTGEFALCLGARCALGSFFQLICQPYLAPGERCLSDLDCGGAAACRQGACTPTWCG
jgi:hypothetical protein